MPFVELRQFIAALEKSGDLLRIGKEVDWDMEVGAISRRVLEQSGPALLFENIKDYPSGYAILNGPVATWRRVAIALDLPPDTPLREIYAVYEERYDKRTKSQKNRELLNCFCSHRKRWTMRRCLPCSETLPS